MKNVIVALDRDELKRLLEAAKADELHYLAIVTAFTHGLRPSEICEMTAEQVKDGYLTVPRKKGSEETYQEIIGPEKELLEKRAYIVRKSFGPKGRLFPWSTRWFQKLLHKYGEKAGLPEHKCTPHKLKHTCAMLAVESGMKIHELKVKLGHKSLDSTAQYLRITQKQADDAWAKAVFGTEGEL